jgi:mannose-6-phosphate isomerase-like protein (cupin superfamily)
VNSQEIEGYEICCKGNMKEMETMTPKQLGPGEGHIIRLLGESRTLKVTPAENGGRYLQFETSTAPGTGLPPHFHYEEDEAFYILAGHYDFIIGGNRFVATSGAFLFAPRRTVHAFTNIGQEVGRMLITVTPGTQHEGLLREVEEITERVGKPPELSQIASLALKYGWKFVPSASGSS